MINTLKGMRINIRTGKPIIANVTGGVSGPAVLPVGLAAVYRVRTALPEIPIIGLGGIDSGEKALEYLYAGANAVEVGCGPRSSTGGPAARRPRTRRPVGQPSRTRC